MARKSTKRPGIESVPERWMLDAAADRREAQRRQELGPVMDAGIPEAEGRQCYPPTDIPGVPVDIGAIAVRYERLVHSQEMLAPAVTDLVSELKQHRRSQEMLAAAVADLVSELEQHRPVKSSAPERHAEPPLTRSEPKHEPTPPPPPPKVEKPSGPTMEDAQRAVLKFLASHEPAEVGKRLAAIGVEKVSTIKGTDAEKSAKYAEVVRSLS